MAKASAAQMKLLGELRAKELKDLTPAEYAMVEREVSANGFQDLKGTAAQIVFNAIRKRDKEMKKARSVAVGDMVSWNASGGTARGKVEHVMREGVLGVPDSEFSIKAEKDDPAVLIRIFKDGEETETLVGHKMSTLKKSLEVVKHGQHDQRSHGAWSSGGKGKYNTDDSEGEDSSEPKNYRDKAPKISYNSNDTEGEFGDNTDDPKWMDEMDVLRPPSRNEQPFGGVNFAATWRRTQKR